MVLVGKVDTLLNIAKADSSASGKQLLSLLKMVEEAVNPYNTDKEKLVKLQNKLRKNAFALIRKQRYREAAATFLLCPTVSMIKSAQNVLAQQYRSPFLAHLVSRLMETRLHSSTSNSAVASSTPFSQTTAASALNIDLAALNDPVADINNNSTNINNATLLIDRSSYVLGIFSAELIKKDILPGLLAAAENSISSTIGRSRFPFEGKPVSAMENDHTSVHFENIGYHGMLDYTAILMAILCSLWLQEEEVLMSTFDTVLPLLTKYLLLLASSSVSQSSSVANGATSASSSSLKNNNRFNISQKASLATTTSPFSSPPASNKNFLSAPSLLLSEKWKLILQIRHSFLHQYKVSQLHLIVTFLESTFHQNYLYSSHQMINFFYSFPFLMESSYFLPKSYSGKVLSFINEFYDFYHLPHEKLLFNNYFLSPTSAASSSSSVPVEKEESKSSKKPSVNTGKRLSNNSFFKYAKNYYSKSISQFNRSTINDVKFMRSNSIGGGSTKTMVNPFTVGLEGVTSPTSPAVATSEQVQQQPLPQSKFNFSSFGKTTTSTATATNTVPATASALDNESVVGKLPEETKKTTAVTSDTKSALDMFDMPPPARRPVAPKPTAAAAAAAVDPFQSATGTGKSALDAFDFAPPMRNTSRAAKKEEPKRNVINDTAPASKAPPVPPLSALDAFDNMGGRRPATTQSQIIPGESTAEKPVVAKLAVSDEKKSVAEPPVEAVPMMKTDKTAVEKHISSTIPPTQTKKMEEDSSSSSSIHAHPPPHPFPSHTTGAAGAVPPSKTTGKVSTDSKPSSAHSVPPQPPTTAPHHRSFEQRIHSFYEKYNPTRIASIPSILEKYKGKEQDLIEKLKKQYNVHDI
jgi:hypothetical protein